MKLVLLLLCFTAAVSDATPVRHTYHVVMTPVSWTDAQSYCRVLYSDLATVVTPNDWMRLRKEMASNNLNSSVWIGLYNHMESWRWSLNDLPNTFIQKWHQGEPDNNGGNQSCAIVDSDGYWYDEPCADTKPFICYRGGVGAERFVGVSSPLMSWTDAQTHCRTFHTDLASALQQTDNNLLAQVASVQGSSWIGLFRDTWKWSDGTGSTKLKWSSGEPDNSHQEDNCGAVINGAFTDEVCTNLHYFICHSFPQLREQKIMRLNMRSDGSVLDPKVQSVILQQIKQKLVENGVEEETTTVSWRVQPDGNIFHKKKRTNSNM